MENQESNVFAIKHEKTVAVDEAAELTDRTTAVEFFVDYEGSINLKKVLSEIEVTLICTAWSKAKGNKAEMARSLGLNRTTLIEKMRRYKLKPIKEIESGENPSGQTAAQ